MMSATLSKAAVVAAVCAVPVLLAAPALTEEATPQAARAPAAAQAPAAAGAGTSGAPHSPTLSGDDEIVVQGRRPAQLRAEIRLAEDAFYDRFNAIDGDHAYDIVCRDELQTGTHIPRRECRPRFELEAQAGEAAAELQGLEGGIARGSGQFENRANYKQGLLKKKMRKLIAKDPQLQKALKHLVDLKDAYETSMGSPH